MPKLPSETAAAVDETEAAQGFTPVPDALYVAQLTGVEVKDGDEGPYWAWEFTIPEGHPYASRKFWNNTSLGEKSRPFFKAMFDAFGVSADTDTDTLVGSYAILSIGTRTIQKGARAGQLANTIREVLPYADADGVAPGDESA